MRIVLLEPQIPQNTGNIGRLCAGHDLELHLIEPLGFELSDRYLKRAGLDYWPHIKLSVHPSLDDLLAKFPDTPAYYFSARAERSFWDVDYSSDVLLVFGREADGLPAEIKSRFADQLIAIPHNDHVRSLNLANSVSVVVYEALRQRR